MKATPIAAKAAPIARENRDVVATFSAAIMKPSTAIQMMFIAPTAKHHEHHGPAAADAIEALVHAEAKGFARLVRPVREEERQGLLAPKPR